MPGLYDITAAFNALELELLASMSRNMKGHMRWEDTEGLDWTQWQAEMLKGLDEYKRSRPDVPFRWCNEKIDELIRQAYETGRSEQEIAILKQIEKGYQPKQRTGATEGAFFRLNSRKLDAIVNEALDPIKQGERAIFRAADDVYRRAIFNAQIYAASGGMTTWQAIDQATAALTSAGLQCVKYGNGASMNLGSYSEMAIRTGQRRASMTGNASKRDEWGVHTVMVSRHSGACPRCIEWQGRAFVDDVYGGGTAEEARETGLPLLSSATGAGLFHPNCRDTTVTYYPGISRKPKAWTEEDQEKQAAQYALEQKQRYTERNIKKYANRAAVSVDPANRAQAEAKKDQWVANYIGLVGGHPEQLHHDPKRLAGYADITKKDIMNADITKKDIMNAAAPTPPEK